MSLPPLECAAVFNITFDCREASRVAEFWAAVTEYQLERVDMPGNQFWVASPDDSRWPRLVFVTVPEEKVVKNRVHLDLMPGQAGQTRQLARLRSLGASVVDDRRDLDPGGWVVLADPEGNEFDLEHG
ncbi:MAG TPA: VOC family protein [Candidatus Dormibacteraeota bacterium]|nr:VOC family protein [Candidatus Dormibacteraeota bacterium]